MDEKRSPGLPKAELLQALRALANGDLSVRLSNNLTGIDAEISAAFNTLAQRSQAVSVKKIEQEWLKTSLAKLTRLFLLQRDAEAVVELIFEQLAPVVSFDHALFYLLETSGGTPEFLLRVAHPKGSVGFPERLRLGEGKSQLPVPSATSAGSPAVQVSPIIPVRPPNTIVLPIIFDHRVLAVIQLAAREPLRPSDTRLLGELCESLGVVLHSIEVEKRTQALLKQSQAQARELQAQQQHLRQSNEELEGKARQLELRKGEVEKKNREIEQARQALREKADQVSQTSKYKSEFLANMSHELRTPLNSMLLLARQLVENQERTMTEKQVEFAKVIHAAGNELLRLINDILDLSKIESGTVTVDLGELQFRELRDFVERNFRVIAKSKNLEFSIELEPSLPAAALTDGRRLEQVLKNLLANAFKFTAKGGVHVCIRTATSGWDPDNTSLNQAQSVVAFSVSDTGLGISENKQKIIFEAFQQGDGGTGRRFGGTGLGLTISREIAQLLGGEIQLSSTVGVGSVFTLYLPLRFIGAASSTRRQEKSVPVEVLRRDEQARFDDRDKIQPGDMVLLSVEDDPDFTGCLRDIARKNGFRALCATRGDEAMELICRFTPGAITLDMSLPDMDGWKILENLKNTPATRHIPVSIISCEDNRSRGLALGTVSQLVKPVPLPVLKTTLGQLKALFQNKHRKLLVIKSDAADLIQALGATVTATVAKGGQAALSLCKLHSYDCVVTDMELPDMTVFHFLAELKKTRCRDLPIILHAKNKLTTRDRIHLRKLEHKLKIGTVRSPERLLDQTALFLHADINQLPKQTARIIDELYSGDSPMAGRRALIVDDDIRNIFALTSLIERHGMRAITAESGQSALEILEGNEPVDVVLMDIMMPVLDGYKTIEALRRNPRFEELPIIAVTAKAMAEDRLKCLQAGASGYVSKPIDSKQLLAILRAVLHP